MLRNFGKFTKNSWKITDNCIISVKILEELMKKLQEIVENFKKFGKI